MCVVNRSNRHWWAAAATLTIFVALGTAVGLRPRAVSVDNVVGSLAEPVRILDTRFGIGGPAVPLGAGRTRIVDLADHHELTLAPLATVHLRITKIPPSTLTTISISPVGGSGISVGPRVDEWPIIDSLNVNGETRITISAGGTPADVVVEVVAVSMLSDEG